MLKHDLVCFFIISCSAFFHRCQTLAGNMEREDKQTWRRGDFQACTLCHMDLVWVWAEHPSLSGYETTYIFSHSCSKPFCSGLIKSTCSVKGFLQFTWKCCSFVALNFLIRLLATCTPSPAFTVLNLGPPYWVKTSSKLDWTSLSPFFDPSLKGDKPPTNLLQTSDTVRKCHETIADNLRVSVPTARGLALLAWEKRQEEQSESTERHVDLCLRDSGEQFVSWVPKCCLKNIYSALLGERYPKRRRRFRQWRTRGSAGAGFKYTARGGASHEEEGRRGGVAAVSSSN